MFSQNLLSILKFTGLLNPHSFQLNFNTSVLDSPSLLMLFKSRDSLCKPVSDFLAATSNLSTDLIP